jgi:heme/copper-type cytochrome/quinol oxidase subunit 2
MRYTEKSHYRLHLLPFFVVAVVSFAMKVHAQTPTNYPPSESEPLDFNTFNIILYIILPILMVVAFFLSRRYFRKRQQANKENHSDNS